MFVYFNYLRKISDDQSHYGGNINRTKKCGRGSCVS